MEICEEPGSGDPLAFMLHLVAVVDSPHVFDQNLQLCPARRHGDLADAGRTVPIKDSGDTAVDQHDRPVPELIQPERIDARAHLHPGPVGRKAGKAGLGVHRDKVIVPLSFLALPAYVDSLCAQLGIEPPALPDSLTWEARCEVFVRHLIARSGRPVYFAPSIGAKLLRPFADRLYSEGLVLRYSEHPYDNLAVMKRNVEQRYQLDYLRQRFEARRPWAGETSLRLNYAAALQPLLRFYRASGDATRLNWLTDLLRSAVEGADCDEETKARYRQLLDADRCD